RGDEIASTNKDGRTATTRIGTDVERTGNIHKPIEITSLPISAFSVHANAVEGSVALAIHALTSAADGSSIHANAVGAITDANSTRAAITAHARATKVILAIHAEATRCAAFAIDACGGGGDAGPDDGVALNAVGIDTDAGSVVNLKNRRRA